MATATEAAPRDPVRATARASVAPAFFAAVAEAGLVFLPLELIARSSTLHASGGPLSWYPLFLALFSGGVAVAVLFRARPRVPYGIAAGCVVVGIVQSVVWNEGGGTGAFVAISLCLLAGVRMVTLTVRDWRDPVDSSFGWGAGILLAEIVIAPGADWGDIVWPIAVLFFLGSLASRGASVRMVERAVQGAAAGPDSTRRWRAVGWTLAGGAALLTGLGLALGTQSGPIDRLAQLLVTVLADLIYWAAYLVAVVLSWILSVVGVDRNRIQQFLGRLGHRLQSGLGHRDAAGGAPPLWERAVGVTVLFLLVGGLAYLVVRQRRKSQSVVDRSTMWQESEEDEGLFARATEARKRRKLRHELPEDAVRRLYAQALEELEERGRPRSVAQTPGEFLRTIRVDLPECSAGMGVLTRAYEDVRYGRISLQPSTIDSLEAEWSVLRRQIRAAPLPEEAAEGDEGEALSAHMAERAEGAAGTAPSSDETFERR